MTIIITGANGQLGTTLKNYFSTQALPFSVVALDKQMFDITCADAIKSVFAQYRPAYLINTAAFTAVDKAESEHTQAFLLNAESMKNLAQQCKLSGTKLIHFSTDYVFDGNSRKPYSEADSCHPLSVYGESKWQGERIIQENLENHFILRVSWLFSAYGHNFLKTIIRLLKEKNELRVINDQTGCPTCAEHVAELVVQLILNHPDLTGLFHYSDAPVTTWYGFAAYIRDVLAEKGSCYDKPIIPISTQEYPTAATRPMYSIFDCQKIKDHMHIVQKDWRTGVDRIIEELNV